MAKQKVPGSREEESWFSEEQLEGLSPADQEGDLLRGPVPTQMVSNGEYLPNPQTEEQKQVERRILEMSDVAARRLGVSRRQFLAGTGGFAVSFLAMNEAHGQTFFKVSKDEVFERGAHGMHGPPRDLFVFDDQLHTIRSSTHFDNLSLRAIAQGVHSGLNPTDLPDELGGINTP